MFLKAVGNKYKAANHRERSKYRFIIIWQNVKYRVQSLLVSVEIYLLKIGSLLQRALNDTEVHNYIINFITLK
jgi:hypothetical protein